MLNGRTKKGTHCVPFLSQEALAPGLLLASVLAAGAIAPLLQF